MTLQIEQFECKSPFYENAFFIIDPESKEFAVADPGDGACEKTSEFIEKGFNLTNVLLTHIHIDHTWDVAKIRAIKPEVPIIMHAGDKFWVENYQLFSQMFGMFEYDAFPAMDTLTFLAEGDTVKIGNDILHVIHAPGHSAGHIAFYHGNTNITFNKDGLVVADKDAEGFCVVGDVIFKGNVGRTDLPGGNGHQLVASIKNKIFMLPTATILYNGHGEPTTVEHEIKFNYIVGENAGGEFIFP